jgi:hypothetical protein
LCYREKNLWFFPGIAPSVLWPIIFHREKVNISTNENEFRTVQTSESEKKIKRKSGEPLW